RLRRQDNGKLQLFRLPSLQLETDWSFDKPVQQVVFSADGKRFAIFVKSSAKPLRVYDVATRAEIASCQQDKLESNRVLTFSPDGKILAGGGYQAITFWEVERVLRNAKDNPEENPDLPKDPPPKVKAKKRA